MLLKCSEEKKIQVEGNWEANNKFINLFFFIPHLDFFSQGHSLSPCSLSAVTLSWCWVTWDQWPKTVLRSTEKYITLGSTVPWLGQGSRTLRMRLCADCISISKVDCDPLRAESSAITCKGSLSQKSSAWNNNDIERRRKIRLVND